TVFPDLVDIVVEANTTAPAFYQGRREPIEGSTVRVVGVVSAMAGTPSQYEWRVGGTLLPSKGQVATFNTPLDDPFLLRLDAIDQSGKKIAATQRYVSLSEPEVVFY